MISIGLVLSTSSQLPRQASFIISSRSKPKPSDGFWLLFALASIAPNPLSLRALALFLLFALAGVSFGESLFGIGGIESSPGIEDGVLDGSANGIDASALATFEVFVLGSSFLVVRQQRRHSVFSVFSSVGSGGLLGLCLFFFRREGPS